MTDREGLLSISEDRDGNRRLLVLAGELDGQTCLHLDAAARRSMQPDGDALALDLEAVTFVDSAGLRTLVTLDRELREVGRPLVLLRTGRALSRLLELTALDQHFQIA